MLKSPTLLALFICFVYSNSEHNVDSQFTPLDTPSSDLEISIQLNKEKSNTFQTIKGQYVEENHTHKPCKDNRQSGYKDNIDTNILKSLPLTATLEHMNTASIGDKIVSSSVHGATYNYKNKNTENNDLHSNNCECQDCVLEANKKVLQFESLEVGGNSSPLRRAEFDNENDESEITGSNSAPINKAVGGESLEVDGNKNAANDVKTREFETLDSNSTPINNEVVNEVVNEIVSDEDNSVLVGGEPLNLNTGKRTKPCNKGLILNTRRRKCGRIDLSKKASSAAITRRILPGLIENPTNQELEENKLYQDGPHSSHNDNTDPRQNVQDGVKENLSNKESEDYKLYQDAPQANQDDEIGMETRPRFPTIPKVSNSYDIDLVHNMNINEAPPESTAVENAVESQLIEPTKGKGIYNMKEAGVMLLQNSRVCYACSTISDSTCWIPDRRTTVKYCQKGHLSCLTKSFKHKGKSIIIRDCGSYCVNLPSGEEHYSSCSICHSDLCNDAAPRNIYSTGIAIIVFFGIRFVTKIYLV